MQHRLTTQQCEWYVVNLRAGLTGWQPVHFDGLHMNDGVWLVGRVHFLKILAVYNAYYLICNSCGTKQEFQLIEIVVGYDNVLA